MPILNQLPGLTAGEAAFTAATKSTGASQTVAYTYLSALGGQPGDVLFGINNTANNYIELPLAITTNAIRSRYYVNLAGLTFGANDTFTLARHFGASSTDTTHRMFVGKISGSFFLNATSNAEASSGFANGYYEMAQGGQILIEDLFTRSSGAGVADATYTLWVNGVQRYQRTAFINYTTFGLVTRVRVGAASDLDAGTSGSFVLGKVLVSNQTDEIGGLVLPSTFTLALSVGDSLVNGAEDWPATADPLHVFREGVASQTLVDEIEPGFSAHLAAHPSVNSVLLEGGVNDLNHSYTLAQMQAAMASMIVKAQEAGKAVALTEISPYGAHANWTAGRQIILDQYNAWLNTLGLTVIPAYATMEDPGNADFLLPAYDIGDGLHFNQTGMRALGAVAATLYNGPVPQGIVFDMVSSAGYGEFILSTGAGQAQAWHAPTSSVQFTIATQNACMALMDFDGANQNEILVKLLVNGDGLTMANNDKFTFARIYQVVTGTTLWAVRILQQSGSKNLVFGAYDDNGFVADQTPVLLSAGPHTIVCYVVRAAGASSNNATVRVTLDGVVAYESSAIDLFTLVDGPYVFRFGPESDLDAGTTGTLNIGSVRIQDVGPSLFGGSSMAGNRMGLDMGIHV